LRNIVGIEDGEVDSNKAEEIIEAEVPCSSFLGST